MDANEQQTDSLSESSESLLSPLRINLYRLRQEAAAMVICLVAGLAGWFAWVGMRQSDQGALQLIAIMGCAIGSVLIFAALMSTLTLLFHSIYCSFRYRFGIRYLVLALIVLPFFAIPYYLH